MQVRVANIQKPRPCAWCDSSCNLLKVDSILPGYHSESVRVASTSLYFPCKVPNRRGHAVSSKVFTKRTFRVQRVHPNPEIHRIEAPGNARIMAILAT